jgi:hypothetical protein
MNAFADVWLDIGLVANWQHGTQQALAVVAHYLKMMYSNGEV